MSSSQRDMVNEPDLAYYDPYMGIAPSQLWFDAIAFPSNLNGYQDTIAPAGPIVRSTHPSHGNSHVLIALSTLPEIEPSSGMSQGHIFPTEQGHQGTLKTSASNEADRPYKCGWLGCTNNEGFKRPACLWRHIKSIHVCAGQFQCQICDRTFNRNDKVQAHIRTVHISRGQGGVSESGGRQS